MHIRPMGINDQKFSFRLSSYAILSLVILISFYQISSCAALKNADNSNGNNHGQHNRQQDEIKEAFTDDDAFLRVLKNQLFPKLSVMKEDIYDSNILMPNIQNATNLSKNDQYNSSFGLEKVGIRFEKIKANSTKHVKKQRRTNPGKFTTTLKSVSTNSSLKNMDIVHKKQSSQSKATSDKNQLERSKNLQRLIFSHGRK